jgi:uncharacterized membrane protein
MRQGRFEAVNLAPDDIRRAEEKRSITLEVGEAERYISLFAGSALVFSGLRRRSLPLLLGGGALIYRGATGSFPGLKTLNSPASVEFNTGLNLEETITVQKPVEELYSLWRRLENLPRFMSHLESVTQENDQQSHWVARLPGSFRLEWDATIIEDVKNQRISWRSLPGSSVDHTGSVFFHFVPARKATEIKIICSYKPPAGSVGGAVAKLLSGVTEHQLK